jgi:hypothetical protein
VRAVGLFEEDDGALIGEGAESSCWWYGQRISISVRSPTSTTK